MSNNDELTELRNRVEQLEENQQELRQGAVDAQGQRWTKGDLLNMGLSRRQAMAVLGLLASGTSIGVAIRQAIQPAAAQASTSDGDDDVGTPSNPVDVFADGITSNAIQTEDLDTARSWQDVTSSRDFENQYTNSTNSEIKAVVTVNATADSTTVNVSGVVDGLFSVGGTLNRMFDTGQKSPLYITSIPSGSTYEVAAFGDTADYEVSSWIEFR